MNEKMYKYGATQNSMRELHAWCEDRAKEIGAENVFDFSIGNPAVPAPPKVAEVITQLAQTDPVALHGYSAAHGLESTRTAIANNLNERYGTDYTFRNFYLTCGAAGALSISIKALGMPGEEGIVIAPYFEEYRVWMETTGLTCVEVPARTSDFQIDIDALDAAINEKTRLIIINSPNNPVGSVYSRETLQALADLLRAKQEEFGAPIYLVSDEPYREVVYDDIEVPWVPSFYDNTIVCYSWSKSLSLPGERIGYVLVPNQVQDFETVYKTVAGAGRALGYVCAPVLQQRVVEQCCGLPADTAAYKANRDLLCGILDKIGYEYIQPQGAFYLWMKALEDDAKAFSEKAKEFGLALVPSDAFGVSGWVRLGYCVSEKTIAGAEASLAELKKAYE